MAASSSVVVGGTLNPLSLAVGTALLSVFIFVFRRLSRTAVLLLSDINIEVIVIGIKEHDIQRPGKGSQIVLLSVSEHVVRAFGSDETLGPQPQGVGVCLSQFIRVRRDGPGAELQFHHVDKLCSPALLNQPL